MQDVVHSIKDLHLLIESVPDPSPDHCHHGNTQTNKPVSRDHMVWALSTYYITLISSQQALPLVRIHCQLFVFKYMFKIKGKPLALSELYEEKCNIPHNISLCSHFGENIILLMLQLVKVGQIR